MKEYLKSVLSGARSLGNRVFAHAISDDRYFVPLLSPALQNLRFADGFVRNVAVLMGGTAIAMVVPIIASPLVTRLYTPDQFGIFALFVSIIAVLSVPVTGNYDSAVMLPKKDGEALNLVGVCVIFSLIVSAVLFIGCLLFRQEIVGLLGSSSMSVWLLVIPPTAFILALQQTFSAWCNRKKQFKRLGANRITESVLTPALSVTFGLYSWGLAGLIVGLVSGKAVATWMLWRDLWREKKKQRLTLDRRTMLEQSRRFSDFPFYSAPTAFLDVLALQVPVLFLTRFYGPGEVGFFSLTTRVIGAPLVLIASCIGQVYYQWIAQAGYENRLIKSYIVKVAIYLILFVAGPVVLIMLFSPRLFWFIFGEEWRVAGDYARILAIPLAAKFVVSPLTATMPASGRIKLGAAWKLAYFSGTVVVLWVAGHYSITAFLYAYAGYELVAHVGCFFLVVKASSSVNVITSDSA